MEATVPITPVNKNHAFVIESSHTRISRGFVCRLNKSRVRLIAPNRAGTRVHCKDYPFDVLGSIGARFEACQTDSIREFCTSTQMLADLHFHCARLSHSCDSVKQSAAAWRGISLNRTAKPAPKILLIYFGCYRIVFVCKRRTYFEFNERIGSEDHDGSIPYSRVALMAESV